MSIFIPSTPQALAGQVAALCQSRPSVTVVAVDGADCARPVELARLIGSAVEALDRPSNVVSLHDYVRPASLRFEFGHEDTLSYRTMWFDYEALDREVITSSRDRQTWLPKLWDETTDRSARSTRETVHERHVLIVAGPMLLGRGLDFAITVRLDMSEAALRRHTPSAAVWTIDALLEHHSAVTEPVDLEVRYDHPARPAVRAHLGR
ncbi:hypothetical protein [Rhodococcus sp. ARC_M6]|uniref:hypothetical protein n=1 Tax=Rhodococcus sp. ARC_M6 TaxID=2928852 RepID=UPI001FB33821|nr:hypothetical protein [Rhodococcus sp. ARC_M6]MCJ0902550.1 hypothetical protein [Rhodococcus sp. ARC_M6]